MRRSFWPQGALALLTATLLLTFTFSEAAARAGRGGSVGSRGSRTYSDPKTYTAPARPTQPSPSVTPTRPTTPAPGPTGMAQPTAPLGATGGSSFWRSFGGGLLGGLVGGLLFRSLFGGPPAHGATQAPSGGWGIGLLDILLLGGIGLLVFYYIKRRREEAMAMAPAFQGTAAEPIPQPGITQPPYYELPQGEQDLERGVSYIRQLDPSFNEAAIREKALDTFFQIQAAWANRDMTPVRDRLTDEMYRILQEDAERLKAEGRINRLENIAVRSVDLTEAWQENGQDYITVRILANMLDYMVDDRTGEVLEGSKTEPVKFEEYWTFTRPVGPNAWKLSAITQPA
ncbi:MAG: Tim44 domain-containing protein [Desulfobaccales bacterium]